MTTTPAPATCTACHRPLHAVEADAGRRACGRCTQTTAARLQELPELYAALDPAPGRSGPRYGTLHATAGSRPPLDLHVLDLTSRGGTLAILESWVRDWADVGHLAPPAQATVGACCGWLRWHLDWAVHAHPAVEEAIAEIGSVYRQVRAAATGERGPATVRRLCPCGQVIAWRLDRDRYPCRGCGEVYGQADAAALPAAPRRAAAA